MSQNSGDRIVREYLDQVSGRLSDLPSADREEILTDLRAHIEESIGDPAESSEAAVRNTLHRLGEPAELAREARIRAGHDPAPDSEPFDRRLDKTPTALEVAAIILTAIFWPVGVIIAWVSQRWRTRDKVIATAVPAAGWFVVLLLVIGGLMAWESGGPEAVSVSQDTFIGENGQAGDEQIEERSPRTVAEPGDSMNPAARLIVVFGFIFGAVASPFFAAVYLAVRLQPVEVRVYPDGRQFRDSAPAGGRA